MYATVRDISIALLLHYFPLDAEFSENVPFVILAKCVNSFFILFVFFSAEEK